jgi:hypothetical protein
VYVCTFKVRESGAVQQARAQRKVVQTRMRACVHVPVRFSGFASVHLCERVSVTVGWII